MIRTVKIMVILGLLALCGTAWCVEPIPNLIAHWKFDEGSGTTAYDSFGSSHGTISGAEWTTGQIDGALSFDGVDDYVDLDTHIGDYEDLSTGTLSVWIRKESTGNAGVFFSSSDGGDNYSSMYFAKWPDEEIKIRISQNDTSKLYWNSDSVLPFGWHHFAYTTDSSGHCAYLDGVPLTGFYTVGSPSTSAFFSHIPDQDTMRIGNLHKTNIDCYRWDGLIDDVRLYDRALSAEEVQQLYQEVVGEVVELEIIGPNEVAENFSASYKAIAYYDNNSTQDVTDSADWQVEPNSVASIETGLLTTEEIYVPQEDITIYAQYTEGEVTVEAEKEVLVFAICPSGAALSFDGDDYVEIGQEVIQYQTFTVSAWVKSDDDDAILKTPFISNGQSNVYRGWIFNANTSTVQFITVDSIGNIVDSVEHDVDMATWHNLVLVRDGTVNMTLFVDGVEVDYDGSLTAIDYGGTEILQFGRRGGTSSTYYLNGTIDDVRIYDRALSAEEIQANMHTRLSGDEPGLVGYWDFDEGEEQVAYDLSPYGNHGRLGSTPNADASDPAWIESDAPIGICSPYLLAKRGIGRAIERKIASLKELEAALAEEAVSVDALEELLASGEFGDLKKGNIGKAKKKIHSAIKHEKKSKKELEKSIEKLEDALTTLGQ